MRVMLSEEEQETVQNAAARYVAKALRDAGLEEQTVEGVPLRVVVGAALRKGVENGLIEIGVRPEN